MTPWVWPPAPHKPAQTNDVSTESRDSRSRTIVKFKVILNFTRGSQPGKQKADSVITEWMDGWIDGRTDGQPSFYSWVSNKSSSLAACCQCKTHFHNHSTNQVSQSYYCIWRSPDFPCLSPKSKSLWEKQESFPQTYKVIGGWKCLWLQSNGLVSQSTNFHLTVISSLCSTPKPFCTCTAHPVTLRADSLDFLVTSGTVHFQTSLVHCSDRRTRYVTSSVCATRCKSKVYNLHCVCIALKSTNDTFH